MDALQLMRDIINTYERHGWKVRRVLLRPETLESISTRDQIYGELRESAFDALWFSRPSHAKREAWELRLISEQPYALFEAFEADESEEDREAARLEMENRMREHAMPIGT